MSWSRDDTDQFLAAANASVRPQLQGGDKEVLDIVAASVYYVDQARRVQNLPDTATVTLTVPYHHNPLWRRAFVEAEPMLAEAYIGLDWSQWELWTITRDSVGDDWSPDPFVLCARGEFRVGVSLRGLGLENATVNRVEPDVARRAAARLLAIAELAERKQAEALEAKP